ncbi:MAG TPA: CusA/CzcA family heavy metal efflux RND transporter [Chitinophagaceae bacterium]|nr:CusA/CzcA family heavy metal efflux RND transporter [Chitinophagaceae bacterium]
MDKLVKNIITFSLRHKLFTFFMTGALAVIGIFCFIKTPIVAFPDFTNTQIRIITRWPGRSAQEIERFVTIPVEIRMNGVQRKINLRSQSMFGLSVVTLVFEDDVDDTYGRQQITALLPGIEFPEGAEAELTPPAGPIDEIFRYTLHSKTHTPAELRTIQDWVIDRNLRTVPGIADVVAFGGPVKTYEVSVNPELLTQYDLTALDVYEAISKSNVNVGGDVIEKSSQAFVVRGIGLLSNIDDIKSIIIKDENGTPVLVRNIAEVYESNNPRLGIVARGREPDVVEGIVLMRKGIDPGPVLKALEDKVKELDEKVLPAGVEMRTVYDRQNLIDFCLHTVFHNVLEGIFLVTLIVFLFMRDWRATLIVSLIIPLSLLFAFTMLYLKGMFANLISIGAIDFGILIDGAVVMVEGVFVALGYYAAEIGMEKFNKIAKLGLIRRTGVDMGKAIFFSKLIIITALIPIFSFEKVEGKLFSPLAYTLGFALLGALLFTLTFVPALSHRLMHKNVKEKHNPLVAGMIKYYEKIFTWVMRNKKLSLGIAAAVVILTFASSKLLGTEFIPHLDEGALWAEGDAPMSISLPQAKILADSMRYDLLKFPEVREVVSQVGRPDDGTDPKGFFAIECLVDLYPKEQWRSNLTKEQLIAKMSDKLESKYVGTIWSFSQPIIDNVNEAIAGIDVNQAVKVFGENLDSISKISRQVYQTLKSVQGMEDVGIVKNLGQPELQIQLNMQKMALYGITAAQANAVIELAIGGKAASQLYEGEKKFDIRVRYQYPFRKSETEIGDLMIPTSTGTKIPLKEIADIQLKSGPAFIYRDNNKRFSAVQFAVRGRDLGGTVSEAEEKINDEIKLPKGYTTQFSGEYESEIRAMTRLSIVVPISLVIIFIILLVLFRKVSDVLLVLLNVPFALAGGIIALLLTGTNFNISAGIGFIALFGICIQNGVIIISVIKQNLNKKMLLNEAIKTGAISRVRPIVMTALMAIFGLLPAALSTGIGSETQKPLAIVIVGGLISATLLTLIIFPVIVHGLYRKKYE